MTEPAPLLSVIMSVYNGGSHLGPAVDSILAQTHPDFEFLIVDDGSIDGSGETLAAYAAKDTRIRLFRRSNAGLVASLNFLIGQAKGDILARMDADDIAYPDRFAIQLAFLDSHPEIGVVGSHVRYIDDQGAPREFRPSYPTNPSGIDLSPERPLLCHPTVMMRRDVVVAVGGYRNFYRHCEDYDLWLRLSLVTGLHNVPETLLDYRVHAGQVSSRYAITQLSGAAIAYCSHEERAGGRPDPFEALPSLPDLADLDRLYGRTGPTAFALRFVTDRLLYQPQAAAEVVQLFEARIAGGDLMPGVWRFCIRLARAGEVRAAARIAFAALRAGAT